MTGIKKILVPIAFSQYSKGIYQYAAQMALALNAELIVVNVINERDLRAVERITSYGYDVDEDHYISAIKEERKSKLNEVIQDSPLAEEKVTFGFRCGNPADELIGLVIEEEIDLVIMGTKAKIELEHVFTGSVAEKLFRRCPAPVLFYKDDSIVKKLEKRFLKHHKS